MIATNPSVAEDYRSHERSNSCAATATPLLRITRRSVRRASVRSGRLKMRADPICQHRLPVGRDFDDEAGLER